MISEILKDFLDFTEDEGERFDIVARDLIEKNKVMNLTALKEPLDIAMLHFYDSLTLCDGDILAKNSRKKVIDIGCGAGFPSLPLAIYCPESHFTLLDSTEKKLEFAREQKSKLKLNIDTLAGRAEELSLTPLHRDRYDIAAARGVARLNILCEWAMPFVRVGGIFVAMKGAKAQEELEQARDAIKTLEGEIRQVTKVIIPLLEREHHIIVIQKNSPTPKNYPRENRRIRKNPL